MSTTSWLNAIDEDTVLAQAKALNENQNRLATTATVDLSQRIGEIYRANPWMKPGEILALAKAQASPELVNATSDLSANQVPNRVDPPDQKGWFRRNIHDKLKTGTRWTFAALNAGPELTTNVASQLFSENDPDGFDGWFKSTSLGTMLANSEQAGEGYFLGGEAAVKQSERARQVRGTINGKAWTVGRGAANIYFTPGSKEYNFLSGFLDAGVAIFADPTVVGSKISGAVKSLRFIPALAKGAEISAAAKIAERGIAGLSQAEEIAWNASKFRSFMVKDTRAKALVGRLVENDDAFDILSDLFKYKIDPDVAVKLADAKNTEQVLALIGQQADRMGQAGRSILPEYITELPGAQRREFLRERLPGFNSWRNSSFLTPVTRLLTEVPDVKLVNGSSIDRANAVKSYENWMKTAGINTEIGKGREFLKQATVAYSTGLESEVKSTYELFEQVVTEVLTKPVVEESGQVAGYLGLEPQFVKELFTRTRQSLDETRRYFIDAAGNPTDAGFVKAMIDGGYIDNVDDIAPNALNSLRLQGPGSIVELLDSALVLPDVRVTRRITTDPIIKAALSKQNGDPRFAIVAADYLQNEIWKPLALATGGYVMRNMIDAQLRMATLGKASFFNKPWEYVMWAAHKKAPASIVGKEFDDFITKTAQNWDEETDFFADAMNDGIRKNLDDPITETAKAIKSGNFKTYNRTAERDEWLEALQYEYQQIAFDPIMNALSKGIGADTIIDYLREAPKGQRALESLTKFLQGGFRVVDKNGYGQMLRVQEVDDKVLREWIERLGDSRVALKTGGDEEMRFILGHRRVPVGDRITVDPRDLEGSYLDGPVTPGKGSLVRLGADENGDEILGIVIDATNDARWGVQQVSKYDVFDTPEGKLEFAEYIKSRAADPAYNAKLPQNVKGPEYIRQADGNLKQQFQTGKDKVTDWFFGSLYGTGQKLLERSPLFRQFYYEGVARYADLLSVEEATKFVTTVDRLAKDYGMTKEAFVGGQKTWKTIQTKLATANGEGTLQQLDDYAQLRAADLTKESLYNAHSRNNLEDILRIVVPFGVAYREVMSTWVGHLLENPTRIRRAQLIYNGATNFDPDNDGQGFFYPDPVSNEKMFNFPFSGSLTKLLTGTEAQLQAPVKRLSLGLQVIPSVGPMVQLAASKLLPDTPKTDFIAEILLPYGRKEGVQFTPGWLSKLQSAIEANPGKLDSIYANTYMETVRALSASGEYDLANPLEQQKLFDDAKSKARILTGLRALSQFVGPTSATTEFMVSTKDGDVMASLLTKTFYDLQQQNYDTAVQEFIKKFGSDAFMYLSSKTRSQQPGLLATEQFGDWERTNEDLLRTYSQVAAYFAPGGDDFSFSVWERQIRTGGRKQLNDQEMLTLAQYRIGSALYRDLKAEVGQYPKQAERDWLARQRLKIHEKYPGFPPKAVFEVNKSEVRIAQLRDIVVDPKLANNEIAGAVRDYLRYRDEAYADAAALGLRSLSGKQAEPLRDWLYSIGSALAERVPDFQRLWDQELSSEVDEL